MQMNPRQVRERCHHRPIHAFAYGDEHRYVHVMSMSKVSEYLRLQDACVHLSSADG